MKEQRLLDPIVLLQIPTGTEKMSPKIIDSLGTHCQ